MQFVKTALLATAAVALATAAQAADPIMPTPIVPAPAPMAFDWNGFYAGLRLGGEHTVAQGGVAAETNWLIGAELGINAAFDMFVLGAEIAYDAVFDDDTYGYGEITARAGVLLAPQALVYGTVGFGTDFDAATGSGDHILAGVGAEFAVTDSISLDARYVYGWEQSDSRPSNADIHKFTIGANFHF